MFTKINKALLWLFITAGIIISIAVGASIEHMGWVIPVGIIATFIMSASLGMLVEIAENIIESRDFLYEINSKLNGSRGAGSASQPYASNGGQETAPFEKNYGNALSKFSAINNGGAAPSAPDFWYCNDCGTKNDRLSSTCKGCGKYK